MIVPARYMSCDWSDVSRSGPVVGRFSTTEMMIEPETMPGRIQPTVLTNGLRATRTGYLRIRRLSEAPLARAVTT